MYASVRDRQLDCRNFSAGGSVCGSGQPRGRLVGDAAAGGQPMGEATGCEDTEPSFPPPHRAAETRDFSVFPDAQGEFSVFSQAVQSLTTACLVRAFTHGKGCAWISVRLGCVWIARTSTKTRDVRSAALTRLRISRAGFRRRKAVDDPGPRHRQRRWCFRNCSLKKGPKPPPIAAF
jgi:hypothetical protein